MGERVGTHNEVSGSVVGPVVQAGTIRQVVLSGAAEPDPLPVPRQLPSEIRDFAGRAEHLAALDALLPTEQDDVGKTGSAVIVVVQGTAGVGKTTLAVHWAHRVQQQFPDGTLFANLQGYGPSAPVDPMLVLPGFLHALGVPEQRMPADPQAQVGLYRSLLAGRRVLIVLDNAGSAEQVRPLLPGSAGCVVVVTSRSSLTGLIVTEAAHRITLDLLSTDEAHELVRGIIGVPRAAAEPAAVAELVQVCARLPLALRVAACRAVSRRQVSVAEVVEEITHDQDRLGTLSGSADESSAVRTVFDWSYTQLPIEQARLFRLLGLHPGPEFGVHAAAAALGVDVTTAYRLLEALADAHLVEPVRAKRYRFHDLLHAYAANRVHRDEAARDRHRALSGLLGWYAQAADTADGLVFPGSPRLEVAIEPTEVPIPPADRTQALAWLNTEYPTLLAALRSAMHHGLHQPAILLAGSSRFLTLRQRALWTSRLGAESLGLDAARACTDHNAEMFLLMRRAETFYLLGQAAESDADYERGIALAELHNNPARRVEGLCGLGANHKLRQRHAEAWNYFQEALPLVRNMNGRRTEAVVECNLSQICARLGRYRQALDHAERELTLRRQAGDEVGEATAWFDQAVAWQGLGDHGTAIQLGERAVDRYRQLGASERPVARALEMVATSCEHLGDLEHARQCLHKAVTILTELGDPRAETVGIRLRDLEFRAVGPE